MWRKGEELWREGVKIAEALGLRVVQTSMRWRRLGILLRLNGEVVIIREGAIMEAVARLNKNIDAWVWGTE
jgi:hypothetical protein